MTVFDVTNLSALEILDSRGRPTLAVTAGLGGGTLPPPGCRQARPPGHEKLPSAATATLPGMKAKECWEPPKR